MVCIETVSFSIELNGHKFDMWKPKRGIRQGNPLSLCIFIICLNSFISKFVDGHKSAHFDGFQINKHTPPIPIICFADDCIIFCKNNPKSLNFFQNTLKTFESEAGLSINKSKAFFSKNTSNNRIREICYLLNLKRGNIGEKYLGLIFNELLKKHSAILLSKPSPKSLLGIISSCRMREDVWLLSMY